MAVALTTNSSRVTTATLETSQGDFPLVRVEVSFDDDLTLPPVWTDITESARSIDYQRGRNFELDQFQSGTLTVVLATNDGKFSPEFTSGPYYGYLTPLRRVRVRAEWNGEAYNLWQGFVETWEPQQNEYGKDLVTELRAADAFKMMRYAAISDSYAADYTGNRIRSLLEPLQGVEVYTTSDGTIVLTAETFDNADPLATAQDAAAAESGFLYCDEIGRVRFDDRQYRVQNETSNRIVFGDVPGETPYREAVYSYNDEQLYTDIRITSDGGTEQVSSDDDAIRKFGDRVYAQTYKTQVSLVDTSPNDAWSRGLADLLLSKYKEPGIRLEELVVMPASYPSMWDSVLSAPLGGRLLVRERPSYLVADGVQNLTSPTLVTTPTKTTGTGGMVERAVFIESIQMSIRPSIAEWSIKYGLSDADRLSYWILGSPLYSVLGRTTRLAVTS